MVLTQKQAGGQKNLTEDPELNPYAYRHLVFNKEARIIKGKKSVTNGVGLNEYQHVG